MAYFKRKNRWYIDYYLPNGKRKREVVTIKGIAPDRITREDAKKAHAIRKAEHAQGKLIISKSKRPLLFSDLLTAYLQYSKEHKKSYRRDKIICRHLEDFFKNKTIHQVTNWSIESYKSKRSKDLNRYGNPLAPATVNREIAVLKHIFTKAIEWDLAEKNPAKHVKLFYERPTKLRVLSNDRVLETL